MTDRDDGDAPDLAAAPMRAILAHVEATLAGGAACAWIVVADPEASRTHYNGEWVDGVRHRPLRVWVELADRLGVRLRLRPRPPARLAIGFEALAATPPAGPARERYGADSELARIDKAEEPGLVLDLAEAVERAALPPTPRVLELGCGSGWALALVDELAADRAPHLVGVDHSPSALAAARARLGPRAELHEADLATLPSLALGRFDLVLAIGVLQSPGVDDRALLRHVVQDRLTATGAVIFGVPNCRYRDGVLVPGARIRNLRQPELGLVVKDLAFYRKYLQQHDREVWITGRHYLFVTGAARR